MSTTELDVSSTMPAAPSMAASSLDVNLVTNPQLFEVLERYAQLMAKAGVTIPNHLKGKPADCMAIILQATKWGMDPYSVAAKTHVVNGNMGYEAQLINAVITSSSAITGRFYYEWSGDNTADLGCRVGAVLRGEQDITWGEWIYARDQTTKNSPLWKTNPKQQLAYLTLKFWARLYTPHVILGVYTPDELDTPIISERDMGNAEVVTRETPVSRTAALKAKVKKAKTASVEPPDATDTEATSQDKRTAESVATDVDIADRPFLSKEAILDGLPLCNTLDEIDEYFGFINDLTNQKDKVECGKAANARKTAIANGKK